MLAPDPNDQKTARERLKKFYSERNQLLFIHYSCEDLHDKEDGSSPRITSIAVRQAIDGQTHSFSIHKSAEILHLKIEDIRQNYNKIEHQMLQDFFKFLELNKDKNFIHWNMRNATYGFAALEHRYRVLGGHPFILDDRYKIDLSIMFIDIYGPEYIPAPRIEHLMKKNRISDKDFVRGIDEPGLFKDQKYISLHKSTLRKVDIIASFFELAATNRILTDSNLWIMHGGSIRSGWNKIAANPTTSTALALVGISIAIYFQ